MAEINDSKGGTHTQKQTLDEHNKISQHNMSIKMCISMLFNCLYTSPEHEHLMEKLILIQFIHKLNDILIWQRKEH